MNTPDKSADSFSQESRSVVIGSDHGGFDLKEHIKIHLQNEGYMIDDKGCFSSESCDYPDFGYQVAQSVGERHHDKGILICKSGIGMSIVANKVKNVRAALCYNQEAARLSRAHNDANILVMGSHFVSPADAVAIIRTFFETPFEGGRHCRRVEKIA
ncbi:MAG: ribose 5-phosphate isomerase B [Candidatus Aureabacteria bacterium]|nr:ribose 5-phosphate isomerase B [Candidatus Auribacterota bacterium]